MSDKPIEELIPSWFEGTLNTIEREKVDKWKEASEENRQIFADSQRAWEGMEQLRLMEKYDSHKALLQVHSKIKINKLHLVWNFFQKVAAIFILPLLAIALWLILYRQPIKPAAETAIAWHTLKIPAGMRSELYLPDSTKVYLNSKTTLSYPLVFKGETREVKLSGEAYFEVAENKEIPFIVNTGKVNIEVTGTEFIATTYPHENLTEIILIEGGINLFQGEYLLAKKDIAKLHPGEKAFYLAGEKSLEIEKVDIGKYIAWKEGLLVFRDDPMPEVVRRLNRWFNVDIQLEGPELKDWSYTATFEDETLEQVLELLKISAPVDYTIKRREMKTDKTFTKMEIIIKQKRRR
jgi:transmembrane sensor